MAASVIMPRQGQSVESCILSKWYKEPGDKVSEGELLFSYETDKASFDEESKLSGILLNRLFEENDDVPCLEEICRIGSENEWSGKTSAIESIPEFSQQQFHLAYAKHKEANDDTQAVTAARAVEHVPDMQNPISPRARIAAQRAGIEIALLTPTGPGGRIIERDVRAAQYSDSRFTLRQEQAAMLQSTIGLGGETGPAAGSGIREMQGNAGAGSIKPSSGYVDLPLTNIRKVISKAMKHSLTSTCQLTLHTSFDATALLALRASFKKADSVPEVSIITLTDMVMFAVSRTLIKHADLNAHFLEDSIRRFSSVHLGLAVDTERGLMVPTLFEADSKSLLELAKAAKSAALACQSGSINPDELKGATFTITNLGTYGIEHFTPVLNAPQTGILGVSSIQTKVRQTENAIEGYPAMGLSLTFDHRAIDGAPAARFLKELADRLQQFNALLAT